MLELDPDLPEVADPEPSPPVGSPLYDARTGLHVAPGLLTAIVSEQPDESAALADRLGLQTGTPDDEVRLGGVPLTRLQPAEVRRRIVVSDTGATLFMGRLYDRLAIHGADEAAMARALHTASAEDVLDALDGGLEGEVSEKGRSFSGGQRQRLVLARALLTDPEVLVLVEPTSAVDAHTEARIAARLREHRAGRSTVVTTSSPLMLDAADVVAYLVDGRIVAAGTHRELLDTNPSYRLTVTRETEMEEAAMRTVLPVAGRTEVRAYALHIAKHHKRTVWTMLGLHSSAALAALAAPRLLGDLVAVRRGGHHARPRRPDHAGAGRVPGRADGADPLRALRLADVRRAGARRAARGLRREHPRAARRHRGVGRLRRPAHPHLPRRRPARLVGALGAAGVDDRGGHRGAHLRRGASRWAGGSRCPACSAYPRW